MSFCSHSHTRLLLQQGVRLLVALSADGKRSDDEGAIEAVVAGMKRENENADLQEVVRN